MLKYGPDTLWVSYSSISDYLKCPKLYYLKNIYKNPGTGYKIQIARPPTTLGDIVHKTITCIIEKQMQGKADDIKEYYKRLWQVQAGERGGFRNLDEEKDYKLRGWEMIDRFCKNWDLSAHKPIILNFPKTKIFKDAYLVGNVDWLEDTGDSLFIMDFKTGKNDETADSLQLPIYTMLVQPRFNKPVTKWAYWYLRDDQPVYVPLKPLAEAIKVVKETASQMLNYRNSHNLTNIKCPEPHAPQADCNQIEQIVLGNARFLYQYHDYKKDVYIL